MQQLEANRASDAALAAELARLTDAEPPQAELQAALATKLERETALGEQAQPSTTTCRSACARPTRRRLGHEQALQPLRDKVSALQLEEQAAQLGGAQYLEQLDAAERRPRGGRPSHRGRQASSSPGLQGEIDALNREIEALGAVNLAALEELGQARERKSFLDAQNADLTEAMTTLEDAIRKIDLETRELLGTHLRPGQRALRPHVPELFGGGNARLVMTGDEILDAGVQVMAQPPGKKNSSIHLLSGGEKALAAIALVFAIFQLNPAPFCLLDEVDAPLDDANTERYAKLVTEMSRRAPSSCSSATTSIAMEMAEQLIGVTMQEQGVSRIVTVDMPSAVSAGRSGLTARAAHRMEHPHGRAGIPRAAWSWPAVIAHGAWQARRAGPKQAERQARGAERLGADPRRRARARRRRRGADRRSGGVDAAAAVEARAAAARCADRRVRADHARRAGLRRGGRSPHLPPTRRVGSKPFAGRRPQRARPASGKRRPPGQRYGELPGRRAARQPHRRAQRDRVLRVRAARSRPSPTRSAARPSSPTCSTRWRGRASSTQFASQHDAQLAVHLRARGAAWSVGYIQQHARAPGFVPGVVPGRLVLPVDRGGRAAGPGA